jgi:thiol-disulfide isomerase/thioredoxin
MILAQNNNFNSNKELKILNFYSDWCPPCHAFMPNFIAAEKTFWKDFDFININTWENMELSSKFWVRWTPTIIIMKNEEIFYNKSWVPNGWELKELMNKLIWEKTENTDKRKKFLWLF